LTIANGARASDLGMTPADAPLPLTATRRRATILPMAHAEPGLRVDSDRLQLAVDRLDRLATRVEQEALMWQPTLIERRIGVVGTDPVSAQLRRNMVTMAIRKGQWLTEYAAQLRLAHQALAAQKQAYEHHERVVADELRAL
jgi:hypothetical protein